MIPILTIIILLISGHSIGRLFTLIFKKTDTDVISEVLYGNILLNFIFISFFVVFAVFSSLAHEFFISFQYFLILLLLLDLYFLVKFIYHRRKHAKLNQTSILGIIKDNNHFINSWSPTLCLFVIVSVLLVFHGILVYYHPIFNEYDALYVFLPISHSIILGNGLNEDFFGGSDLSIRYPPFIQAMNAWILDTLDYPTLRLFPIYFITLMSFSTYVLTRRLSDNKFISLVAVSLVLITPAMLVISSRFSLQLDLAFIAFLVSSALTFFNVVHTSPLSRFNLVLFLVSISLLPLIREIGLIISWNLLFLFISYKFTSGNKLLKGILTVISLAPLYFLTINDIRNVGITSIVIVRILTLIAGNILLFFIKVKSEPLSFKSIKKYLIYFIIIAIPLSFVLSNVAILKGPYPTIMFSSEFSNTITEYRSIFDIQDKLVQSIDETIKQIPRIELLLSSVALGSLFILFKIRGFFISVKDLVIGEKKYFFLISFIIILVIVWSYLLSSNFKEAGIRHIAYFVPFLSILVVIGLNINNNKQISTFRQLYIIGIIVLSLYYFVNYDVLIKNQSNHFYAIWIDPLKSPIINISSLAFGILTFLGYVILELVEHKYPVMVQKFNNRNLIYYAMPILLGLFVYTLISTNIQLVSLEQVDYRSPGLWENNVFDVVNYLNIADEGSVLSIRTPAISYFTNRTNYDVFNPHTFGKIVLPLLNSNNISSLEKKFDNLGIKYIILPNSNNPAKNIVENIEDKYKFKKKLLSSSQISVIPLQNYTIYKYLANEDAPLDLLENSSEWKSYNIELLHFAPTLLVLSETHSAQTEYNRIFLDTHIYSERKPMILFLNYSSDIVEGNASFNYEVRNTGNDEILYSKELDNTEGEDIGSYSILPSTIVNKDIEIRFYIISHDTGKYYLKISQAKLLDP